MSVFNNRVVVCGLAACSLLVVALAARSPEAGSGTVAVRWLSVDEVERFGGLQTGGAPNGCNCDSTSFWTQCQAPIAPCENITTMNACKTVFGIADNNPTVRMCYEAGTGVCYWYGNVNCVKKSNAKCNWVAGPLGCFAWDYQWEQVGDDTCIK